MSKDLELAAVVSARAQELNKVIHEAAHNGLTVELQVVDQHLMRMSRPIPSAIPTVYRILRAEGQTVTRDAIGRS